jgi:hypothetical protein
MIYQESSRGCILAIISWMMTCACNLLSSSCYFSSLSKSSQFRWPAGHYIGIGQNCIRILNASGMCSGSTAFAHIMARRFLTGGGSKSDEKVRSNNPRNASESFHFSSSVRLGRGSRQELELRKPGKPEKKLLQFVVFVQTVECPHEGASVDLRW